MHCPYELSCLFREAVVFFQAEDGIRDDLVTGVQTCALPICTYHASLPGVIDAWYVLLDRWGTMTFAQVLEQAIDVAENGFPIRSEERRVGKEGRSRWAPYPAKENITT